MLLRGEHKAPTSSLSLLIAPNVGMYLLGLNVDPCWGKDWSEEDVPPPCWRQAGSHWDQGESSLYTRQAAKWVGAVQITFRLGWLQVGLVVGEILNIWLMGELGSWGTEHMLVIPNFPIYLTLAPAAQLVLQAVVTNPSITTTFMVTSVHCNGCVGRATCHGRLWGHTVSFQYVINGFTQFEWYRRSYHYVLHPIHNNL